MPDKKEDLAIRSFLVWHTVILKKDAVDQNSIYQALWENVTHALHITKPYFLREDKSLEANFPVASEIRGIEEYERLSLRVEEKTSKQGEEEYAYVYSTHDTLGFVVFLKSEKPDDHKALRQRIKNAINASPIEPLGTFLVYGAFAETHSLPAICSSEAIDSAPFLTDEGFSLWSLSPDADRTWDRLAIAANPTPENYHAVTSYIIGPEGYYLPPQLEYQINAVKIRALSKEFRDNYETGGATNLRAAWRDTQSVLEKTLTGLNEGAPDDNMLIDLQRRQGELSLAHQDLQRQKITVRVAQSRIASLQPQRKQNSAPFTRYVRDRERADLLEQAIDTEANYIHSIIESIKAMHPVYVAINIHGSKVRDEQRKMLDEERNYFSIVQTALVGGLGTFFSILAAIDPSHRNAWYGWASIAFFSALGFGIPAIALRLHSADFTRRWLERIAFIFLLTTFVYLTTEILLHVSTGEVIDWLRSITQRGIAMLLGVLTVLGALATMLITDRRRSLLQKKNTRTELNVPVVQSPTSPAISENQSPITTSPSLPAPPEILMNRRQ